MDLRWKVGVLSRLGVTHPFAPGDVPRHKEYSYFLFSSTNSQSLKEKKEMCMNIK